MAQLHVSIKKAIQRLHAICVKENIIIHWSVLKRCTLILYYACILNTVWIVWKSYLLVTPSTWRYVYPERVLLQLTIESISLFIFLICIYICQKYAESKSVQRFMPFFCIALFTLNLGSEGYSVGIFSPATAAGLVGVVGIGLLIFSRLLVYFAMVLGLIGLGTCTLLSLNGSLVYAPLFNTAAIGMPYTNPFWVGTMGFFMAPLLLSFIFMFEVLLAQWRYRESIIQRNSQIDPLTNLYNRRKINDYLHDLKHSDDPQKNAVILLDLDHFKRINDQHGHDMGDLVLVKVSEALRETVRNTDIVGRFGGEEFIILLNDADYNTVFTIAERCRQAIEKIEIYGNNQQKLAISASFGICHLDAEEPTQITLKHADDALYAAKAAGRNRIQFYNQLMNFTPSTVSCT